MPGRRAICHFPVTVRVSGEPTEELIADAARALEAALVDRLRAAGRELAAGGRIAFLPEAPDAGIMSRAADAGPLDTGPPQAQPASTMLASTAPMPSAAQVPAIPPTQIILLACPEAAGKSPPNPEPPVHLPPFPAGDFGGDPEVATWAEQLASWLADRLAPAEVRRQFDVVRDKARRQATVDAAKQRLRGRAATSFAAEAVRAVARPDGATVRAALNDEWLDWLRRDFPLVMDGARQRPDIGPAWEARQDKTLDQLRKDELKRLRSRPTVPRGETPPPATSPDQIDAQVEAALAARRCEIKESGLNVLENWKHAWMVARANRARFKTEPWTGLMQLGDSSTFHAARHVEVGDRVKIPTSIAASPEQPGVAREMVTFLVALEQASPGFTAGNREGHGSVGFTYLRNKLLTSGFSVDLSLRAAVDDTGFYDPNVAIEFLLALDRVARAKGAAWKVLYNDFRVAEIVNYATGATHVAYEGTPKPEVWKDGKWTRANLNFHGPSPFVLHFHLDLMIAAPPPPVP
jgi:hypothetical protein